MSTRIPTNNARRIPVQLQWLTSPMRLIQVKELPVPSLVIDEWLQGAELPALQPIQRCCRAPIAPDALPV
jgi:hypothetical protein